MSSTRKFFLFGLLPVILIVGALVVTDHRRNEGVQQASTPMNSIH